MTSVIFYNLNYQIFLQYHKLFEYYHFYVWAHKREWPYNFFSNKNDLFYEKNKDTMLDLTKDEK